MAPYAMRFIPYHNDPTELAAVYDISLAVNRSLDLDLVLQTALDKTIELLGAQAGCVYLLEGEKLTIRAEKNLTPAFIERKSDVSLGEGCAGRAAMNLEIYAPSDDPGKVFVCADSEKLMGLDCLVAVPLVAKARAVGILELFAPVTRRLAPQEGKLLSTIAAIVGAAVENARLYAESQKTVEQLKQLHEALNQINRDLQKHLKEESRVARTLQQVLLPDALPEIKDFEFGAYYLGGSDNLDVGGDFYDATPISDTKIALIIGDICGKGLDAAVQTAEVKYALKTYLLELKNTSKALKRINRVLVSQEAIDSFATAIVAIVDLPSGEVEYASAGHPPPIRLSGKTAERLHGGGLPLGVEAEAEFPSYCFRLEPGQLLALYTDGLIETRSGNRMFGIEGVEESLPGLGHLSAEAAARALAEKSSSFAGGDITDDLAILLVRRLDG